MGNIFQRLPDNVSTGVVELIFDDDKLSILIHSQQVQPFVGIGEAVELFLDNQQFFAEYIRIV